MLYAYTVFDVDTWTLIEVILISTYTNIMPQLFYNNSNSYNQYKNVCFTQPTKGRILFIMTTIKPA